MGNSIDAKEFKPVFELISSDSAYGTKIKEWGRSVNLIAGERFKGYTRSHLISTVNPELYILIIQGNKFKSRNIEAFYFIFKYQTLLNTENLDYLTDISLGKNFFKDMLLVKYEEEFDLNIYFFYICCLIQKDQLERLHLIKSLKTKCFPKISLLEQYLPFELSKIVQEYLLADSFIVKGGYKIDTKILHNFNILTTNLEELTEDMKVNKQKEMFEFQEKERLRKISDLADYSYY